MEKEKIKKISAWPGHSSAIVKDGTILRQSTKNISNSTKNSHEDDVKPVFLTQLESKINNQMRLLEIIESEASATRLKVVIFSSIFDEFIRTFNLYGPLLARIKNEYDIFINFQTNELKEALYFKEYVNVLVEKYEQKVSEAHKCDYEKISRLENEIKKLTAKLSSKEDNISYLEEVCDHLKLEIAKEAQHFRQASDARNLLIVEIAEMKHQFEEYSVQRQRKANVEEDPTMLRIALEQAKEAQRTVANAFERMKADYSEVVSKTEHDKLLKSFELLTENTRCLIESKEMLSSQFEELKNQLNETIIEKENTDRQYNELLETATPRADWNLCQEIIPGGANACNRLFNGKSSKQRLVTLVKFFNPKKLPISRPLDSSTPRFLRTDFTDFESRVNINQRDLILIISQIWTLRGNEILEVNKEALNQEISENEDPLLLSLGGPQLKSFDEFLLDFFNTHFPIEIMRIEWSNGFYDALENMADVEEFSELRKIIDNELDEACHWHVKMQLEQVKLQLYQIATVESIAQTAEADRLSPVRQKSLSGIEMSLSRLRKALIEILFQEQTLGTKQSLMFENLIEAAKKTGSTSDTNLLKSDQIETSEQEIVKDSNSELTVQDTIKTEPTPDPIDTEDLILVDLSALFIKKPGQPMTDFCKHLIRKFELEKLKFADKLTEELRATSSSDVSMNDLKTVVKNVKSSYNIGSSKDTETARSDSSTTQGESSSNAVTTSQTETDSTVLPIGSQEEQGLAYSVRMNLTDAACSWLFKLDYQAWPYCLAETLPLADILNRIMGCNLYHI